MRTLRTSEIFNDARFTLIAVEGVDFRQYKTNNNCQVYGNIEPIAVIVCSPDTTYAIDMQAKPADFELLRQNFPELDTIIAPFNKAK